MKLSMTVLRERYNMHLRRLEYFAFRFITFFRRFVTTNIVERLEMLRKSSKKLKKDVIYIEFCKAHPTLESDIVSTTDAFIEYIDIGDMVVRNEKGYDCFHHVFISTVEHLLIHPALLDMSSEKWGEHFVDFRGLFERVVAESIVMRQKD